MSFSHYFTTEHQSGVNSPVKQIVTITGEAEQNVDVAVPDSSTDLQIDLDVDVSQLRGVFFLSDKDVTIETNNGTTPDDTLALQADEPVAWCTTTLPAPSNTPACPLTVDVAKIYVTNASGATANVKIRVVQDATP